MTCRHCGKPLPERRGPGRHQEYCDATCRSAARRRRASVNAALTPGAPGGTLGAVGAAHRRVLEAQDSLRAAIDRARAEGHTWQEIGDIVGTTRQAAFQRFGKPVDPSTGGPMTAGVPDAADRALRLLTDYAAARFERVSDEFDETLRRALDTGQLATVWARVVGSVGAFERFGEPVAHAAGDLTVVDVLMHFEAGTAVAQVSFRPEGTVAGLYLRTS